MPSKLHSIRAFAERGYKVIYFHRKGSVMPYDFKTPDGLLVVEVGQLKINTTNPQYELYTKQTERKQKYKGEILEISYDVLFSYLYGLHRLSVELQAHKDRLQSQAASCTALVYLAAAVSDFYMPHDLMSEHKIQSREVGLDHGGLTLHLVNTPKYL